MIRWQRHLVQYMLAITALSGCALAQEAAGPVVTTQSFGFFRAEGGAVDKVVKGAPYTADAVTETVQTLANGNRIVHKTTAQLARDSDGRTRREQTVDTLGPWATAGSEPLKIITLNDPVAGVMYHLDPRTNTATKFPSGRGMMPPPPTLPGTEPSVSAVASPDGPVSSATALKVRAEASATAELAAGGMMAGPATVMSIRMKEPGDSKTESLGQQTIGDLVTTGTRTTRTIPAGTIGNEQPIEVTSETWYSPDLQMIIMSKHNDPQIGESTYTLTNIQRSAPPQSLFEVPANYTIREEPMMQLDLPSADPSSK